MARGLFGGFSCVNEKWSNTALRLSRLRFILACFVLLFYPIFYASPTLIRSVKFLTATSRLFLKKENYFRSRNRGMALILPCSILIVDVFFSVLK